MLLAIGRGMAAHPKLLMIDELSLARAGGSLAAFQRAERRFMRGASLLVEQALLHG
jgi:ABC-type branched-subunit amino acid transport system ATPase component